MHFFIFKSSVCVWKKNSKTDLKSSCYAVMNDSSNCVVYREERYYYFSEWLDIWFSGLLRTHPVWETTRWCLFMWLKSTWWIIVFLSTVQYFYDYMPLSKAVVALDFTLHSLPFRPETQAYEKQFSIHRLLIAYFYM